ncbi:MAG TPA: ribonuclease T [Xanthomonadales bacterium]|nr:ribonuclease T [Xanthomonadales bacterium]
MTDAAPSRLAERFRGFLPVVVDVETGGFNHETDALLEVAAIVVRMDEDGWVHPGEVVSTHVVPFPGANLDPRSLEITGIDPTHPFRFALEEREALNAIFTPIRKALREYACNRAILVGHNAAFDLNFLNAAIRRTGIKRSPFHQFSAFDTVSLGGLAYGQTVLGRAVQAAGLSWNGSEAHSAVYDAERTAELFCRIVNRWKTLSDAYDGPAPPVPVLRDEASEPAPALEAAAPDTGPLPG